MVVIIFDEPLCRPIDAPVLAGFRQVMGCVQSQA